MTPAHADSFLLWIRICQKFPDLPLKNWAKNPTSHTILNAFSSILQDSLSVLPTIHPIWYALAEINSFQLVTQSLELFKDDEGKAGILPLAASVAAFDYLEVHNFIQILEKYSSYYSSITGKYVQLLQNSMVQTAKRHIESHKHRTVSIISALLRSIRSHSAEKLAAQLNDEETKELASTLEDQDFATNMELLWAQAKRQNVDDTSILASIFKQTLSKLENDSDRRSIIPFLVHVADLVLSDGSHWFSLISPSTPIHSLITKNKDDILKHSNSIIKATQEVHKIVGMEEHEIDEITDFDLIFDDCLKLIQSNCEVCKAVGRCIALTALPAAPPDSIQKFDHDPILIVKSLAIKSVSKYAIPLFIKNLKKLPTTFAQRPENIILEVDDDDVDEVIQIFFDYAQQEAAKGPVMYLLKKLINDLPFEKCQAIVQKAVKLQLTANAKTEFILLFYQRDNETANYIVDTLLEYASTNKTPSVNRKIRELIDGLLARYEFSPETIGNIVTVMTNVEYSEKISAKKRAEEIFTWADYVLAKYGSDEVPLDKFKENLKQYTTSTSKLLRKFAKRFLEKHQ
ncbi:hypothetical protein GPJ56_004473 [Histomonas meleagridis]|uniref:uncharacterized protein n=1 Tax=Histomonas meleagridis TaxID=135588 RepID=UPI00355A4268|nr:hypothetical protein GPJ56_004473 [Histomonas meleagridis]KAH0801999.1 hypothetical protein GO595_005080 [Histomonas meleagridis]